MRRLHVRLGDAYSASQPHLPKFIDQAVGKSDRSSLPILTVYRDILFTMSEITEKKISARPQLEGIFTENKSKVLQLADRGELPCPRCKQPLYGQKLIEVGIYEDVVLVCLEGCGWREF